MGRSTRIYKKRIGPDVKKRWSKVSKIVSEALPQPSNFEVISDTPNSKGKSEKVSSSKKKLGDQDIYETYSVSDFEYCLIDIKELQSLLLEAALCKNCKKNSLQLHQSKHAGLASTIQVSCTNCNKISECQNSKCVTDVDNNSFHDVNLRLVYGMRCIGRGKAAADMFCAVMNLPPPPFRYYKHEQFLEQAAEKVCKASMAAAVTEAITENDGDKDLSVALDGSWQKRGHTSLNGVVSCTSLSTGKVLDIEVMSKYCRCINKFDDQHDEKCYSNYKGTSGGMEVAGALAIFNRSKAQYDVQYVNYLGDGDSRAFDSVIEAKPYGDCEIKKIECVGHVKKRMGRRLREMRSIKPKPTLEDGKPLTGKNRLTLLAVGRIQEYYSLAIKRNHHSVSAMKSAIWASYFHIGASDNQTQKHGLCPQDPETTWCKYIKAKHNNENYRHEEHFHLPEAVMKYIKPAYQALSDTKLLEKCVAGKTQNPNESLNSVIWRYVPKKTFVAINTLRFGVYEAVSTFNDGNRSKCEMFKQLGVEPGKNLVRAMKMLDLRRVARAEKLEKELQMKIRKKRKFARQRLEEKYEEEEGPDNPSYEAGKF